jgi:hypothetical protein
MNTSPDSLSGPHNVDSSFSLINSPDDYVMMSVADSTGIDMNYDLTITPRVNTAPPLVVNNTAGTALLTVGTTGGITLGGAGTITLPTTYTSAPSTTQLGYIIPEATNSSAISLATAYNAYQCATVSLNPGIWLILAYVNVTVTSNGSFYINITTSTGPNYAADDLSAQNSFYGTTGVTLNTQCTRLVTKTSAGATVYTVGVSAATGGSGSVGIGNCKVKAIRIA